MSHLDRKIREKETLKCNMLKAARKIAAKEGWPAVTIRRIADEIEYTPPIVYEYFENKEALLAELINSGFKGLLDDINAIKRKTQDPKEFLLLLSIKHWEFAAENHDLFKLMFSPERPTPSREMKENMDAIRDVFMQLAGNDEELCDELMLNWTFITTGALVFTMKVPPGHKRKKVDFKRIYTSSIERFLKSI